MDVFKIIMPALFLFGCNSPTDSFKPKSFDSKTSKLFFNANTKNKYDELVNHFQTVGGLKKAETGWTIYPPLSALHQEENNITKVVFGFQEYLGLSSGLKDGLLVVRKIGPDKDALAVIEINLEFKCRNDAETFYKEIVTDFDELQLDKEESLLENVRSTLFHDNSTSSVLIISWSSFKDDELYSVTLRLVPGES